MLLSVSRSIIYKSEPQWTKYSVTKYDVDNHSGEILLDFLLGYIIFILTVECVQ
jgi:hypothetical protein